MPPEKVGKLLEFLGSLRVRSRSYRRCLQSHTGALQWASAVLPHLRPWLAAFYRCINAPLLAVGRRVRINAAIVKAARLWCAALRGGALLLNCRSRERWPGMAAADAWAAGNRAGIGGWWKSDPCGPWWSVHWFHLEMSARDLQPWIPLRGDLQKEIAWFELLAQIVLLVLKCHGTRGGLGGHDSVQMCDNSATVVASECCFYLTHGTNTIVIVFSFVQARSS